MPNLLAALTRFPSEVLIGLVRTYRLLLSPSLGSACRFEPSCSAYSLQALQQFGAARGSYLTLKRLVRCQPWCEGGYDPLVCPLASHDTLFTPLVTSVTSNSSTKKPS